MHFANDPCHEICVYVIMQGRSCNVRMYIDSDISKISLQVEYKGPDQTARMRRLVWAFVVAYGRLKAD